MGQQAKKVRERTCQSCGKPFIVDAKQLKRHWEMCIRVQKIGLVLPGEIERPREAKLVP